MEFGKKLTDDARDALAAAEVIARSTGALNTGTSHILLGILNQPSSRAAKVLAAAGVDFDAARHVLRIETPIFQPQNFAPTRGFSEMAKLTLRMSIELANEFNQDFCGTEHLLFSLLNQPKSRAIEVLETLGVDIVALIEALEPMINSRENSEENLDFREKSGAKNSQKNFLEKFGVDLTKKARKNQLDPVIGREKEIARLVTILGRRTKNNPVLIGEAGVGKTAVVEGVAEKIARGDVPDFLLNKKIVQLDLAALVAGTKFRGEFEDRMRRVIDEARRDQNLLLFIDEIHLIAGAGSAEGSMDAAQMIKPSLARGEMRLIGATTADEYRKTLEKDSALARRFQTIIVRETSASDTEKILAGIREKYENHHKVQLSDEVLTEAVRLSERYLPERHQPDKAIDVIDEAAARVHIAASSDESAVTLRTYKKELRNLTAKMDEAAAAEDYERAALLKVKVSRLNEKIAQIEATDQTGKISLKRDDIARAVSAMTGVPLSQIARSEATKLLNLEKKLNQKIINQQPAVAAVARAVRRSRSGIAAAHRPIGSFIFLGPTGVGKTALAREIAREIFGSEKNLIKLDMSEFSERHTAARLVGAPAGYVGYDDGGGLTEKIRRNPYSVVLFDEFEKAHPQIFNLLLQILEDGNLTDGHGRTVDFSNTVVILTSNIGAEKISREAIGFSLNSADETVNSRENSVQNNKISRKNSASNNTPNFATIDSENPAEIARKNAVMKQLRETLRPELLNRFDNVILFNSLSRSDISRIFDLLIEDLNQRLAAKGVAITVAKSAKDFLIEKGYSEKLGARPLRRTIEHEIEDSLAEKLIAREIRRGDLLRAKFAKGEIVFEKLSEKNSPKKNEKSAKNSEKAPRNSDAKNAENSENSPQNLVQNSEKSSRKSAKNTRENHQKNAAKTKKAEAKNSAAKPMIEKTERDS